MAHLRSAEFTPSFGGHPSPASSPSEGWVYATVPSLAMVTLPIPLFFSASRSRSRSSLPLFSVCARPEAKHNVSVIRVANAIVVFMVLPLCTRVRVERLCHLQSEGVQARGGRHVRRDGNRKTEIWKREERDGPAPRTTAMTDHTENGERHGGTPSDRSHDRQSIRRLC